MLNLYNSAIFCSKSLEDQKRIIAATVDPVNLELVEQIATYLDPEYQTRQNLDRNYDKDDSSVPVEPSESQDKSEDIDVNVSSTPHSAPMSIADRFSSLSDKFDESNDESESEVSEEVTEESIEEPVEEQPELESSTKIAESAITATTNVNVVDLDSLLGTLNVKDDTNGAVRVKSIDNEVWIYYNDKVNLNNIMEAVIKTLSQSGYVNLEFNRLARSENAIVFVNVESAALPETVEE